MKNKSLDCYVRPHRRRWGLSQKELAFLLGRKSSTAASRLEWQKRNPNLAIAFACEILFGACAADLFPGLFAKVEEEVLTRAYDLYEQLQGNPSTSTRIKLDLFEDAFARAKARGRDTV